jgi:hypothetical protein
MALTPHLTDRAALLDLLDGHPYARLTSGGDQVRAYRRDGAVVWIARGSHRPVAASMGERHGAVALFADLAAEGSLDQVTWLHLPRVEPDEARALPPAEQHDHWDYQWTTVAPAVPDAAAMVALDRERDRAAIEAVLDDALPDSTSRPGDPRVRAWYGLREDGDLVAVAGDRSMCGVGFLAGIAVRTDRQGPGAGRGADRRAHRSAGGRVRRLLAGRDERQRGGHPRLPPAGLHAADRAQLRGPDGLTVCRPAPPT